MQSTFLSGDSRLCKTILQNFEPNVGKISESHFTDEYRNFSE